jgi:hypothetical protein
VSEKARRFKRLIRMTRRADAHALKIHRCLKHLCRMGRRGAARTLRGAMRNPMDREALKPGRQKRAAPNINCMGQSCGELEAREFAQFFLEQDECAFAADARQREKPGRHGLAEKFPQICHAPVRLRPRLNQETIGALLCPGRLVTKWIESKSGFVKVGEFRGQRQPAAMCAVLSVSSSRRRSIDRSACRRIRRYDRMLHAIQRLRRLRR